MHQKVEDESKEWNAGFIAPLLIGAGIGTAFGAAFTAGSPWYVAIIMACVGAAITLSGLVLQRSLKPGS